MKTLSDERVDEIISQGHYFDTTKDKIKQALSEQRSFIADWIEQYAVENGDPVDGTVYPYSLAEKLRKEN